VYVRLDEARQDGAAARVDGHVGRGGREVADGLDAAAAHEHVARDDRLGGVHRDDGAALDEDSLFHLD
jgi:hypothetical protein